MSPNSVEKITNVSTHNAEAVSKSSDAAMASIGTIGKSCQEMATRNIAYFTASIKALSSVKTPEDFFEVQQKQMQEGLNLAIANSRTIFGLTSSAYTNAVEPLREQATKIQHDMGAAA